MVRKLGIGLVAAVAASACSSGMFPEESREEESREEEGSDENGSRESGSRESGSRESVQATQQALDQACVTQCMKSCYCPPEESPTICRRECLADCRAACACTPSCAGKACGASDGCDGICSAGSCPSGQTCGGGGIPNQCGCVASCAGKACGASDGCGGVCSAGACPNGQSCGGGGVPNQCGCTPSCAGQNCGAPDGCGGSCSAGACPGGDVCGASGVPGVCAAPNPSSTDFVEITSGNWHSCARKRDGSLYCWGGNALGQIGIPSSTLCTGEPCVNRPRLVTGRGFTTVHTVEAGGEHTCALNPAGKAYCWGSTNQGQIGAGVLGFVSAPVPVNGDRTFSSISAGRDSTCGTTHEGLFCWGHIMGERVSSPVPVLDPSGSVVLGATNVSVGYLHACARTGSGATRTTSCFGLNRYGQAGSNPLTSRVPPMTATLLAPDAIGVTTQGEVTCANLPSNDVQCFGYGYYGALGNGQSGSSAITNIPQTVGAAQSLHLHGVTVGESHGCALDANGAAYCWGVGTYGQLGDNNYVNSAVPVPVAGGLTFRALAAGYMHTCGIGRNNHLYCWGRNYEGQLGTTYPGGYVGAPVQAMDP